MKKSIKYISIIILTLCGFLCLSCQDNLLKEVNFSVTTEKSSYNVGEEIIFNFENPPAWVTFFSGEEDHVYPDSYGRGIKGVANELFSFSYVYTKPGTYEVVFVGGNTNYKGKNEQVVKLIITITE